MSNPAHPGRMLFVNLPVADVVWRPRPTTGGISEPSRARHAPPPPLSLR